LSVTRDELTKMRAKIEQRICALAYNRLGATRQIEACDKEIAGLEEQHTTIGVALTHLATDEAIATSKENEHA
jgi:hypothetical protein